MATKKKRKKQNKHGILPLIIFILLIILAGVCGVKYVQNHRKPAAPQASLETVRVTFPEGYTILKFAKRLELNDVCSQAEFLDAVAHYETDYRKGISNPKERIFVLEGYLFPDSYEFYKNSSAEAVLKKILQNTDKRFASCDLAARAEDLGMSVDEVLTLASMVQAESGHKDSMPYVASVFHNRLNYPKKFSKLQSDVTYRYVEDCADYVKDKDATLALYNTYICKGLPAGPICNPGLGAIEAVLDPADSDYFYFVSDKNQNFYYAKTYDGHKENCKKAGIR